MRARRAVRAQTIVGLGLALALGACRSPKTLTGRVVDYDTGRPVANARILAAQSGWGFGSTGLVWDKSYDSTTTTDASGRFDLHYSVGDSANLVAAAAGYSEWRAAYAANAEATIRLRTLPATSLRLQQMSIGVNTDGSTFGWDFAAGTTTTDAARADLFPETFSGKTLQVRAGARGGIRFVSAHDLGVQNDFLVFAPPAADDGFQSTATIVLDSGDTTSHGAYLVRTADGGHFAKFQVGPGIATGSGLGVRQSALFMYVFDPSGGRELPYGHAPLAGIR